MSAINKKELHEIFVELKNVSKTGYNSNDKNPIDRLYKEYYSLIYGITFSILKSKENSEDVAHDIFAKICDMPSDKLPTDNEASWLYTVSKNECFMYIRKEKPLLSTEEIYEISEELNELDKVIDIDYYNNLIARLKDDEKSIVSMKVLSNFTFKKISQVMNIPIGTVQWKYYRAINSLKVSVGSLVGAIMAFIVVLARGEFWRKREYLNSNKSYVDSSKEDGSYTGENGFNSENGDEHTTHNEESGINNIEDRMNQDDNISNFERNNETNTESSSNTNLNHETEKNTSPPGNTNSNQKNEENTDKLSDKNSTKEPQKSSDEKISESNDNNFITGVSDTSVAGNPTKMNTFQLSFIVVGTVLLIISIIFYKIYQQKLGRKSSK